MLIRVIRGKNVKNNGHTEAKAQNAATRDDVCVPACGYVRGQFEKIIAQFFRKRLKSNLMRIQYTPINIFITQNRCVDSRSDVSRVA